jgi:hypothetical protein
LLPVSQASLSVGALLGTELRMLQPMEDLDLTERSKKVVEWFLSILAWNIVGWLLYFRLRI